MGRPVMATDTVRFVGEIVAVVVSEGPRDRRRRRRARGRGLRPAARRRRPARGREGRGAPVPGSRHERRRGRRRAGARRDALRRLRRRRLGHAHQPADGGLPARAALRRGRGRRRRPPHRLALDADARTRTGSCSPACSASTRRSARRRAGRRRRLRREDGQRRGDPRRLARAPDRAARALDGDALREHGRAQPRPRPGADVHDRRGPRGEGRRVPARDRGRRGRLPGPRRLPAEPDRPDVERRLRVPDDRDLESRLRHEHDRRSPRSAARAGRRPRRRSSARWTSSPPSCSSIPAEIRRRNFIPKDAFPYTTASHAAYDSGDYEGALDLALRSAGYDELRAEQRRRREEGGPKQLGIGISTYVEITNGIAEKEFGEVEITADGGAILRTGSFSHGQGHETTFAMIAAEQLGLPLEKITVVKGDTDAVASGHRHVRLEVAADRRLGREGRVRGGRRAREEAHRRLPRGGRVRHRARPGARRLPSRRLAHPGAHLGGARRRRPPPTGSSRSSRSCTSSRALRPSRSARTSPWSRSTSRRRRSSCCGWSRSTTPEP